MKKLFPVALIFLVACGAPQKDYDAMRACQERGEKPGTAGYEQCIKDEKAEKLLKQQQREFEQMKQDERDWKLRRY